MPKRPQSPDDLEAALRGESPELAAKHAVYRLARSGAPGAKERLAELLRAGTDTIIRRRAALGLSLVPEGRTALLDSLDTVGASTLAAVLLSLARVGTREDLHAMRAAAVRLSGHDAAQARFAALLLAHRWGLGFELVPPIPTPPSSQVPVHTKPITTGRREDTTKAWERFVPNASLGLTPDARSLAMVDCPRRSALVIPSVDLVEHGPRRLLEHRALIGATAAFERETGAWHHDLWILSMPVHGGVALQAWTQGGRACYTGPGRVEEDHLIFELRTVEASHLALVHIHGRLAKTGLAVDGTVGDRDRSGTRVPRSL